MSDAIRAIDLCCGAGGWACAAKGLPIHITHAFDRWPEAAKTYEINHPGTAIIVGDLLDPAIQNRVRGLAGQADLVLGGIPCEQVSPYRNGWNPKTKVSDGELAGLHTLLDSVLGLVRALAPRWWCIEDVTGIVRHLPPLTPWRLLDAAAWSAQRRVRAFMGDFPSPAKARSKAVLGDCLRPGPYRVGPRLWDRRPVTSSAFAADTCYGLRPDSKSPTVAGWIASRRDAECGVLDERLPGGKRQMEWQEGARLQGFPDDYLFYGSPTSVAKMIAAAIQIDLGRAILEAIVADERRPRA